MSHTLLHFTSLLCSFPPSCSLFFFFNDTATTEIYTLSLHDALPICRCRCPACRRPGPGRGPAAAGAGRGRGRRGKSARAPAGDRKSTRLNSSHSQISYAVFCLKKKKKKNESITVVTHKHNQTLEACQ